MPNALCHFELMSSNPQKCREFYGALFDWSFDDKSMHGYTLVHAGQEATGGIFPRPKQAPHACMNVYFTVNDIDRTLSRAAELGGKVLVPRTTIPGTGEFAMFADPEGVAIGIMQPKH
jgi:predicted enzyme related to lactoylglutathione lyase